MDPGFERRQVRQVREGQFRVHKLLSVTLHALAYPPDFQGVPVGDEGVCQRSLGGQPVVVVLDDHQPIPRVEVLLLPQDPVPDLLVEQVRPLVRSGDHHHAVLAIASVQGFQKLLQVVARQGVNVRKSPGLQGGEARGARIDLEPQLVGVPEDAAVEFLTDHLGEFEGGHRQAKPVPQNVLIQRRTQRAAHGRQLRIVPHEDDAAVLPIEHEGQQVLQQTPVLEGT